MAVASPRKAKASTWRNGVSVDLAAERAGLAYALINSEREATEMAREDRQFATPEFIPDDGLDHYDPADSTCIGFASPLIGERDPNADVHDRYTGTVYDR